MGTLDLKAKRHDRVSAGNELQYRQACISYEEEVTCMSHEEEDTCMSCGALLPAVSAAP